MWRCRGCRSSSASCSPSRSRFQHVSSFQRNTYFITLLAVALATACLIAPSAAHRLLFHQGQRPWLIAHANRMLLGGLLFLGVGLVGAVLLVTDYLFDGAQAYVFPPALALILTFVWLVRPLLRRSA